MAFGDSPVGTIKGMLVSRGHEVAVFENTFLTPTKK